MDIVMGLAAGIAGFAWSTAKVLIPLMLIMEIFKDLHIMDRIAHFLKPVTDFYTVDEKSGVSVVVGILFGLLYGAGVIIKNAQDDNIDLRSIFIICVFLSLCHAVIEDTFIFASIGAKVLPIFVIRFAAAAVIALILSRLLKRNEQVK